MNYTTNKEKLGKLGEDLVASILGGSLSENKYDTVKDMTALGKNIEVKTQNRHPNGSFTVNAQHQTNLKKCLSVDRLIFVEYDATSDIKIFECLDREGYNMVSTRPTSYEPQGRVMVCWPISKMTHLSTVNNPVLAQRMRELSGSKLYNANSNY